MNEWVWSTGGMIVTGETEVLGKNLYQYHSVRHKFHVKWHGIDPWSPRWKADECVLKLLLSLLNMSSTRYSYMYSGTVMFDLCRNECLFLTARSKYYAPTYCLVMPLLCVYPDFPRFFKTNQFALFYQLSVVKFIILLIWPRCLFVLVKHCRRVPINGEKCL